MTPPPSLRTMRMMDLDGTAPPFPSTHTATQCSSRLPSDEYPPPHDSQWYEVYAKASPSASKKENRGLPPLRPHHDSGEEDTLPAVVPSENTG
ncbi:hypothetical protein Naga_101148g1 [Nannochloropsis gaditana]|uniref:Uncharacterized protein n=1 Tax=Nannochloropsis gaditana TaxID=72520 RepID=W7SZV8_9STRA|nr:hypothetical protein Naga_101148g1 [Nannochloropsis gaditana]